MILKAENRPRWDDLCDHGSVVKRLGPCSDIIYLSYQGKLGVCARDLCLLRCAPPPPAPPVPATASALLLCII